MSAEQKQEAVVKPLEAQQVEPFGWVRRSERDGYPPAYHFTTEPKTAAKWQRAGESPRALYTDPAASSQERIAQLEGELRRITDHLEEWARYHSDERTAETDAAIYCARRVIGRAALAAQPLAETGGEWKTVPFEPTEAMLSVGIGGAHGVKRRLWQLMLAAAPERIVGAAK